MTHEFSARTFELRIGLRNGANFAIENPAPFFGIYSFGVVSFDLLWCIRYSRYGIKRYG